MPNFHDDLFSEDLKKMIWIRSLALTRNHHDAEDLVHETYLRALEREELFDGKKIDRWLLTICRNIFFDKQKKKKELLLGEEQAEISTYGEQESVDVQRDLEFCLKKLEDSESEILAMKQIYSNKEISEQLNISQGNLRVKLHRAKIKLAECMEL